MIFLIFFDSFECDFIIYLSIGLKHGLISLSRLRSCEFLYYGCNYSLKLMLPYEADNNLRKLDNSV